MAATPPIRLLFLLQRPESWINLVSVWRLANDDPQFEPQIWVLPYNASAISSDADHLARIRRVLASDEALLRDWTEDLHLESGMFEAVIFSAPYDRERPPQFHFDLVAQKIPCSIYIPYGVVMGGGRKNQLFQYAQRTQTSASAIIARSSYEKALYRKYCPTGDRHVHVLGLPRMDSLLNLREFDVDPLLVSEVGERFPILWNSHFSFTPKFLGSAQFSTFDLIGPELFKYAIAHPDIALIWRPHPGLIPAAIEAGMLTSDQVVAFKRELEEAGIIFDDRPDHRHAFVVSQALLTDLGSFLVEYLTTGKPILYLENPSGEGLNEEGQELVRHFDIARSPEEVIHFIERLRREGDLRKQDRLAAVAKFLPHFDGHAGSRVLELIRSMTRQISEGTTSDSSEHARFPLLEKLEHDLINIRNHKASTSPWKRQIKAPMIALRRWLSHQARKSPFLLRAHSALFPQRGSETSNNLKRK